MTGIEQLLAGSTQGPAGSASASWDGLVWGGLLVAALVAVLFAVGRPGAHPSRVVRSALRLPDALARLTGLPAWAAIAVSTSTVGLLFAGFGFFRDVAYHVAYGRDTVLFTSPHTAIVVGLALIAAGAWAGVAVATVQGVDTPLRVGRLRVPWSLLPLGVLGIAALLGFPIDEAWHQRYGVDVTMWSPPHLIMILGAAFSGLAMWLVLAESGVGARSSLRGRVLHAIAALLTFQGLMAPLGEFSAGVPQFQQLYHPVLVCLAAGTGIVLMRTVLGRGWALGLVATSFVLETSGVFGSGPIDSRPVATFLGAAFAVELAAAVWGTRRRVRFAVLSGVGIGTLGLGVEWVFNQQAHQPWTSALFPDAFVVGLPAAVAGAVLGAAIGTVIAAAGEDGHRQAPAIRARVVAPAVLAVVAVLLVPLPRQVGDVAVTVTLTETTPGRVSVEAVLDPPGAADDARWFIASSWQNGGHESVPMVPVTDGVHRSDGDVAVDGWSKSLLRLHRGAEMMTVPIRLPADPAIGEPEIPAVDRTGVFEDERRYLLRETRDGPRGLAIAVHLLFVTLAGSWVAAFAVAGSRLRPRSTTDGQLRSAVGLDGVPALARGDEDRVPHG